MLSFCMTAVNKTLNISVVCYGLWAVLRSSVLLALPGSGVKVTLYQHSVDMKARSHQLPSTPTKDCAVPAGLGWEPGLSLPALW